MIDAIDGMGIFVSVPIIAQQVLLPTATNPSPLQVVPSATHPSHTGTPNCKPSLAYRYSQLQPIPRQQVLPTATHPLSWDRSVFNVYVK